ncbi:MAG: FxsA family protein [Myxococcota bacterium]
MRWIALFVGLPIVELSLLIEIGGWIGTPATLGLIVLTGVVGASLARRQGLRVLGEVQRDVAEGRLPAGSLVDGLLILVAAAVLLTPGVLTDVFGFLCLTPGFRDLLKRAIVRRLERAVAENRVHVTFVGATEARTRATNLPETEIDVTGRGEHVRRDPSEPGPTLH